MLSQAENRLCIQALLNWGRGIFVPQPGNGFRLAVVQKSCGSKGVGRHPTGCRHRQASWKTMVVPLPSTVKLLGLVSTGIPMPKCNLTRRAALQHTLSHVWLWPDVWEDTPGYEGNKKSTIALSQPSQDRFMGASQLLVSDEESRLALFVKSWKLEQFSCGIRCVWQPWQLQLDLMCCQ